MAQLTPAELKDAIIKGDIDLYDPNGNKISGDSVPTQVTYSYVDFETTTTQTENPYYHTQTTTVTSAKDEAKEARNLAMNKLEREYEAEVSKLSAQDKIIDLQMNQNNTELQACETECESVKSLLDKNIERDFTLFG